MIGPWALRSTVDPKGTCDSGRSIPVPTEGKYLLHAPIFVLG